MVSTSTALIICLIGIIIILYLIGLFLVVALTGANFGNTKELLSAIFYPITIWFKK